MGATVAVAGLLALPGKLGASLLVASLLFDIADGWLARRMGQDTDEGALWDWTVDVSVSHAIAWRQFGAATAALVAALLFAGQCLAIHAKLRVSGRALVTLAVVGVVMWET